jgi:cardiolipin synthase A/B
VTVESRFPERELGLHRARWLATVDEAFHQMQLCIDAAQVSVRLETYMVRVGDPAATLLAALMRARQRGVVVRVLIDAFGSEDLPPDYLAGLSEAGAQVAVFNPKRLLRLSFRNHRKILACDSRCAVIGGFNIAPEYAGDGVDHGWCDTGLRIDGPVVTDLEHSFDSMFDLAPFGSAAIQRFRRRELSAQHKNTLAREGEVKLLVCGPAVPGGALRRSLRHDLRGAEDVAIAAGYFLPSIRIRRQLYQVTHRKGRVRLLLAGHTDVAIAKLAAEHLYARLLSRLVQISEYQPQVLHAKVAIMDGVTYVGSCNLDRRSLHINYELLLRLNWPELTADARQWFDRAMALSTPVEAPQWRQRHGYWRSVWSKIAYLLLSRLDPLLARRRFRAIS